MGYDRRVAGSVTRLEAARATALAFLEEAYDGVSTPPGKGLEHARAVADVLRDNGYDETLQLVGLLHDVVEDTSRDGDDVRAAFGDDAAGMVMALTEDRRSASTPGASVRCASRSTRPDPRSSTSRWPTRSPSCATRGPAAAVRRSASSATTARRSRSPWMDHPRQRRARGPARRHRDRGALLPPAVGLRRQARADTSDAGRPQGDGGDPSPTAARCCESSAQTSRSEGGSPAFHFRVSGASGGLPVLEDGSVIDVIQPPSGAPGSSRCSTGSACRSSATTAGPRSIAGWWTRRPACTSAGCPSSSPSARWCSPESAWDAEFVACRIVERSSKKTSLQAA